MAICQTTRPRPLVLAALLALACVKADDCASCFVEPVRAGAASAALIVGDAITESFYAEVDALLDDTPPDAAECTAAEGGAGVVTTRRGSSTARVRCAIDARARLAQSGHSSSRSPTP